MVTVTASIAHPRLGCSSLEEVPEGVAPRVVSKLKPESLRKQKSNTNVIDLLRFRQSTALGEQQTNVDAPRAVQGRFSHERPATAGETPALPGPRSVQGSLSPGLLNSGDQDPISRHIASVKGDLLSWLCSENLAFTGPRLSESEDTESWIEAIVTKWEKERGPIPKKELLPHEIG